MALIFNVDKYFRIYTHQVIVSEVSLVNFLRPFCDWVINGRISKA